MKFAGRRGKTQDWIIFSNEDWECRIRVLKAVTLPNGVTETLLTKLNQKPLQSAAPPGCTSSAGGLDFHLIREIQSCGWKTFSCKTEASVSQDFYATLYLVGFAAVCTADVGKIIDENDV